MKYSTVQKTLKCKECGHLFTIHRKAYKNHSCGHIKHLYCVKCMNTTAHIEMSEAELCGFQPIYREYMVAY